MTSKIAVGNWQRVLRQWVYNKSGFNRYGLYTDDVLRETPDVEEALRRLPPKEHDERAFRLFRAVQLSMLKTVLPKDEWTKWDDKNNFYLQKLLAEVQREMRERKEWQEK